MTSFGYWDAVRTKKKSPAKKRRNWIVDEKLVKGVSDLLWMNSRKGKNAYGSVCLRVWPC